MNSFEAFCLMFYALDNQRHKSKNDELVQYLSDLNPFLWGTTASADPCEYKEFNEAFPDKSEKDNYYYDFIKEYLLKVGIREVTEAFSRVTESDWIRAAEKYLASPHKGRELKE